MWGLEVGKGNWKGVTAGCGRVGLEGFSMVFCMDL